jgi:hypothetical protein
MQNKAPRCQSKRIKQPHMPVPELPKHLRSQYLSHNMPQFLAPELIRLKRKRNDAPLETLRKLLVDLFSPTMLTSLLPEVENGAGGKRRITDNFIFKRVVKEEPAPIPVQSNGVPIVQATLPGEELRNPMALRSELLTSF